VGADGAHSRVRDQLGVELAGKTYPTQALLADVRIDPELDRTDEWPTILDHRGIVVGIRFGDQVWRIIEQAVDEHSAARPCTATSWASPRNCSVPGRSRSSGAAPTTNTNGARTGSGTDGSPSPATPDISTARPAARA
jgi:hypothetical protein